jgi:hypothetical protein
MVLIGLCDFVEISQQTICFYELGKTKVQAQDIKTPHCFEKSIFSFKIFKVFNVRSI